MQTGAKIDLLRALEVFIAAADSGSMTKAARHLKVTQSAISQQLKLLEADMGVMLMDRNTRPLLLTPAGHALRAHAGEMLLQADQARAKVRQIATASLPHLRIAMFGTLAATFAPALVKAVVQQKLAITTVSILRGMAIQHARDLSARDVDVVITSNPLSELEGLEYHELIHERFVLIVPQKEPGPQTSLRDLAARLPMIRYSARTEAGRLIEQLLRRLRLDIPQGHSFDSPEDLFAMIAMGQGWAITPPTHIMHALSANMPVQLRPLPKPGLSRSIVLVARKGELGALPQQIAAVCRSALRSQYLPRLQALMPTLADHLRIVEERNRSDTDP
jgi:DNA-binding transcriptional LysR family regulator